MPRRIVAIGGGHDGRGRQDLASAAYELAVQDQEIIRLTGKEHPNFLFLAHSQLIERQEPYYKGMVTVYGDLYGCQCKNLKSTELSNMEYARELVEWADIIYEGGGNTLDMIALWRETGLDKLLEWAWNNGKVMCGISAGGNCWFKECSTDSLKIKYGPDQPFASMECLGFLDGLFVPHCNEPGRLESLKEMLKKSDQVGISMSNCAALEIVDEQYRLIVSRSADPNFKAYGLKSYWKDGKYIEIPLDTSLEWKPLKELTNIVP